MHRKYLIFANMRAMAKFYDDLEFYGDNVKKQI